MDVFDKKIIGYESIKKELRMIADTLIDPDKYAQHGITPVKGILLVGVPGTGKSTLARCFADYTRKPAIIVRKTTEGPDFLKEIVDSFEEAKTNGGILILEDLDKFSSEHSSTAPEWVTLQSAIDDHKDDGIFLLATLNNAAYIPQSLLRAGRFDLTFDISVPTGKVSRQIIEHYLADAPLGPDVDLNEIARIMQDRSCSELEAVVKQAECSRIYENREAIERKHLIDAALKLGFHFSFSDQIEDKEYRNYVALHEAGHIVAAECCWPESFVFATVAADKKHDGVTFIVGVPDNAEDLLKKAIINLGGLAAVEVVSGEVGLGSSQDIRTACDLLAEYYLENASAGFLFPDLEDYQISGDLKARLEHTISAKLGELMNEARKIMIQNYCHLLDVRNELSERGILTYRDLENLCERKEQ